MNFVLIKNSYNTIFLRIIMKTSLEKYRTKIQENAINPLVRWDGKKSGVIFDPKNTNVPLDYMGFGAYRLDDGPFTLSSGENEYVLIPVCGEFEISVGGKKFEGSRPGGPFATEPEFSNSSAVYVGRNQTARISGKGEMIWFSGLATSDKPAVFIKPGDKKQVRRGTSVWHREVVTLITTDDVSTNLVVGETYSPPGLWSGTPLHVHDANDIPGGESDHEEVYYHLARNVEGAWGGYGVQLLFDEKGLDKAYMVHHRDAMAIPGGAHPVVVGPATDMIYIWALASDHASELKMKDIPEFAYLKNVEKVIDELENERGKMKVSRDRLAKISDQYKLVNSEREMLRQHLMERGFEIA
jgi:5-deoxy-D-glucuronate isomerase